MNFVKQNIFDEHEMASRQYDVEKMILVKNLYVYQSIESFEEQAYSLLNTANRSVVKTSS